MEFTDSQLFYVFNAVEEKLFRLEHQVNQLLEIEPKWEIEYHIKNINEEREELREVRKQLQIAISSGGLRKEKDL